MFLTQQKSVSHLTEVCFSPNRSLFLTQQKSLPHPTEVSSSPNRSLLVSQVLLLLGAKQLQVLELHRQLLEALGYKVLVATHVRLHLTTLVKHLQGNGVR